MLTVISPVPASRISRYAPQRTSSGYRKFSHGDVERLRYVLEVTSFCFDPDAAEIGLKMRELQDLLGELHDCDVLMPRVDAHAAQLRTDDAQAAAASQPGTAELECSQGFWPRTEFTARGWCRSRHAS